MFTSLEYKSSVLVSFCWNWSLNDWLTAAASAACCHSSIPDAQPFLAQPSLIYSCFVTYLWALFPFGRVFQMREVDIYKNEKDMKKRKIVEKIVTEKKKFVSRKKKFQNWRMRKS